MTMTVKNRKPRGAVRRLSQILFGSLFSSALLFQGTGYISSGCVLAEESANANRNVDATVGATLNDPNTAIGLTGPGAATSFSTTGTISILSGGQGFVAVLDETSKNSDAVLGGVSAMLNESASIVLGAETDATSLGYLSVAGLGTDSPSTLTAAGSSKILIESGGALEIGGPIGSGELILLDGAQLLNVGTSTSTLKRGVIVASNGKLTVGSETKKATGSAVLGTGETQNQGTISIYNESGSESGAYFGVYSDVSGAQLSSKGFLSIERGTGTNGALTIAGALNAEEWTARTDATLAATSSVKIENLATIGTLTSGATMTIAGASTTKNPNVEFGGLKIVSSVDDDGKRTGGKLVLDQYAMAQFTGLGEKMNAAGETVATGGLYDVWLGSNFELAGTLISAKSEETAVTSGGVRWLGSSTIAATGGLYAKDLAISVGSDATDGSAKLTNSGSLIVTGDLSIALEDSAKSFELVNLAESSKSAWIESWTLESNRTLTNGVAGDSATKASIDVNKLTLSGGTFQALGASTTRVSELTIDADSSGGTNAALRSDAAATITVKTLNLIRGLATLESSTGAGGLKAYSAEAVYTIGKADQAADAFAQLQILGTDAKFDGGTVRLEGQGSIVQEKERKLTFDATSVVNNSQRTGDAGYALSADTLVFSGASSYSGGKTIRTNSLTFDDGSTLNLGLDDDLVLSENGSLYLKTGASLAVEFDADGANVGKAVVSGAGVAELAEGSVVKAANVSALENGKYSGIAIETNNDKSVFKSSTETTAFYSLTANATDDGKSLNVELNIFNDASLYATNANQSAVAEYVDSVRGVDGASVALNETLDDFLALKNGASASAALQTLGGVQRANSLTLAANSPWRQAFANTALADRRAFSGAVSQGAWYRGQVADEYDDEYDVEYGLERQGSGRRADSAAPRAVWYSTTYRGLEARSDGNSEKFGISDVGMSLGYEVVRESGVVGGIAFGYAQPRLYSDAARINVSNFQLGAYGGGTFVNGWETKIYVGGGVQDYTSKRTVEFGDTANFHRATFDGRSLAAALQFGRPFQTSDFALWRPVVRVDSEQIWQDAATESGVGSALIYEDADWNRTFARAGLEYEYNAPFVLFNARALYGVQIGGDSAPTSTFRFAGFNGTQSATVCGVEQGESFFDFGLGANGYLDCERRWTVGGVYDFVASEKTTSHVGSVNVAYLF